MHMTYTDIWDIVIVVNTFSIAICTWKSLQGVTMCPRHSRYVYTPTCFVGFVILTHLPLDKNGHYFTGDIFRCIFLIENASILIWTLTNDGILAMHRCITGTQWVNWYFFLAQITGLPTMGTTKATGCINSSAPRATKMRQWIGSALVEIMVRCQAIIQTSAGILSIGPLGTKFNEILIKIQIFSFMKMHLRISSAKWRPFCPGGDGLYQEDEALHYKLFVAAHRFAGSVMRKKLSWDSMVMQMHLLCGLNCLPGGQFNIKDAVWFPL